MLKLIIGNSRLLILIVLSALLAMLMVMASTAFETNAASATLYTVLFLNNNVGEWVSTFLSTIPILLIAAVTAETFTADLHTAEVFVFHRLGSAYKWFILRQVTLFMQMVLHLVVYFAVLIIGFSIVYAKQPHETPYIISVVALYSLFAFSTVMIINVLSVAITPKWSVTAVLFVITVGIVTANNDSAGMLVMINPVFHIFSHWRIAPIAYSLIYNFAVMFIMTFLGLLLVKTKRVWGE